MLFEKQEYMERVAKVKKSMAKRGMDALLVTDPANICWLTGHNAWSFYVHQAVVIEMDDDMPRYIGRYMDAFSGVVKLTYLDKDHVHAYPDYYVQNPEIHPMNYMAGVLKELGYSNKTIGIEKDSYWFTAKAMEALEQDMPEATFVDATVLVSWEKIIKSDKEIELIRRAGKIVDKAMQAGIDALEPGVRQCDVAAAIINAQVRGTEEFGGDYVAIAPLMPMGENAGAPHLTWTDDPMQNDLCLYIEIAGCHQRYHCPMSRTVYLGEPSQDMDRCCKQTIEGLEAALEQVKPGNLCEDVEAAWRKTVAKYGIEKESRIGYSTGLNYPPDWGEHTASLRPGDKTVLQPNMVFHCIPGIYADNYGASISQCIRVTETGYERMSSYPFDLVVKR